MKTQANLWEQRVCDLDLSIDKSPFLIRCKEKLFSELQASGLSHIEPHFFLGDEWFSPDGAIAISIPFYLAHPKLRKTSQGPTKTQEVMKYIRHETGHALDHAYGLSKTARWKKIFGDPTKPYRPNRYEIDPESSAFVQNLDLCYSQSHPYEDFAETFAVWLDPRSSWQRRYKKCPLAYEKLLYVEEIAKSSSLKKKKRSTHVHLDEITPLRGKPRFYFPELREGS
jgi:hypothetical protein